MYELCDGWAFFLGYRLISPTILPKELRDWSMLTYSHLGRRARIKEVLGAERNKAPLVRYRCVPVCLSQVHHSLGIFSVVSLTFYSLRVATARQREILDA